MKSLPHFIHPMFIFSLALLVVMVALPIFVESVKAQNIINAPEVTGSISGTVTDENGVLLANVTVALYRDNYYWSEWKTTTTDATGHYQFHFVSTGLYQLKFSDPQGRVLPEFYNDAMLADDAEEVSVAGNDITDVNAQLALAGGISGTVKMFDETTPDSVEVFVYAVNDTGWLPTHRFTQADGLPAFTLRELRPGDYKLEFKATYRGEQYREFYNNSVDVETASLITVAPGAMTTGVELRLGENPNLAQVSGKVLSSEQTPLEGIRVTAYTGEQYPYTIRTTQTDESGAYQLRDLAPGNYRLGFADPNDVYGYEYYADVQRYEQANSLVLAAGSLTEINAELAATGRLAGSVTMFDGTVPWGTTVELYSESDGFTDVVNKKDLYSYSEFEFTSLAPGNYRLLAKATHEGYTYAEYYGGAFDIAVARDILIEPRRITGGINVVLGDNHRYGSVAGVVSDHSDTPLPHITVTAYATSTVGWQPIRKTETDQAGQYELAPLKPASYTICYDDEAKLFIAACLGDSNIANSTILTIEAGSVISEANITLEMTGAIAGTVTRMPENNFNTVQVEVYHQDGNSWTYINSVEVELAMAERVNYIVGGLATGVYRVKFTSSDYYDGVMEYYDDAPTIAAAQDVTVTDGLVTPNIDAVLGTDSRNARIEGIVTNNQAPIEGIQVVLYHNMSTYYEDWRRFAFINTGQQGNYRLDGLDQGEYRLMFIDPTGLLPQVYYGAHVSSEEATIGDALTIKLEKDTVVTGINVDMTNDLALNEKIYLPIVLQ
ncbi:MAG: carboxypeptidase regulatory-like domain-containing protein [Caldilineaceae bacterium]